MTELSPREDDRSTSADGHAGNTSQSTSPNHDERREQKGHRPPPRVPTENEALAALTAIAQMLLLGLINTTTANALRGVYQGVLAHLRQQRGQTAEAAVNAGGLERMLQQHPEYANLLEPFMTEEQIATLLRRVAEMKD